MLFQFNWNIIGSGVYLTPASACPAEQIGNIVKSIYNGSLLSQLFDGNPQLRAHPHEFKIGHPKNWFPSALRHNQKIKLGLDFNDILLMPTFYGSLIQANTSFKADGPGIVKSTLDRYKTLSREEIKIIEEITEESYQSVINLTCRM